MTSLSVITDVQDDACIRHGCCTAPASRRFRQSCLQANEIRIQELPGVYAPVESDTSTGHFVDMQACSWPCLRQAMHMCEFYSPIVRACARARARARAAGGRGGGGGAGVVNSVTLIHILHTTV